MQTIQLDVWHSAADSQRRGAFEQHCEQWLPAEELQNADRYRLVRTRNQHVIGRAMARRLLAKDQVGPHDIRFCAGTHGKPEVDAPPSAKVPFNIAHTDGLVVCGITDDDSVQSIGVDVESLHRRTTTEVADRYFSEPEVDFLRSQKATEQKFYFLKIWTLKESFIKAIGTGLFTPLADFAFEGIETAQPQIRFLNPKLADGRSWHFICHQPRDGFIATAAVATQIDHTHVSSGQSNVSVNWRAFDQNEW
ncbi:4'-phosphopantetheinyl transferase superfamily protein [Stieleria sp. JC731]|uniref:4'-phosphopantetheinyl transferase family protein n=1 Tax=Pirellulaceae TaxID=2691357 RepID=UPI001E3D0CAD|nr:4'-phosphopantetheinyl transferase superfamily protein [Stieleria sp. JC731]MCC9600238.1 4'-phosphopantetheinyl transferase superfamily protein [Stieleria sp. JC731]